jgi:hypothetical protein
MTSEHIGRLLADAGAHVVSTQVRDNPIDLEDWMARSRTPDDVRAEIRARLDDERAGGRPSGLRRGLASSGSTGGRGDGMSIELPRTAIIGAGIRGLTAGKMLTEYGVPYECFESSDRVGGNFPHHTQIKAYLDAYAEAHTQQGRLLPLRARDADQGAPGRPPARAAAGAGAAGRARRRRPRVVVAVPVDTLVAVWAGALYPRGTS